MNINSLNAINAYKKVNSFKSSGSASAALSAQNPKSQAKANTDTISFKNSEQGIKEYESKVLSLKNQVQSGNYRVDADKIASKILNGLHI
ncbi:MAG: flagellar biosynthesis anti-sigma factor FlgM [Oscillospiraceae bacterium]